MAVTKFPNASVKAMLDALVDLLDAGAGAAYIKIFSGVQPTDPDGADQGTLLAQCTMSDPAFGSAQDTTGDATVTANAISPDTQANNTGTAGHYRAYTSAGVCVIQGDVTATGGGGSMEIDNVSITANGQVNINSFTIMMSET